jgi:simple sugar transport system permease protein
MLKAMGFTIVKANDLHPVIQVLVVIPGIVVALFLSGVLIKIVGADPIEAFTVMFKGAFGDQRKILETLLRSSPLILTGLATVVAFRAQIWSIGQEGQLIAGAMLAYTLYRIFQPILYRPALLTVIILGGFLGGALLALISSLMKVYFNVDIIISTVLLNYIVRTMLEFLLYDHKYWMGEGFWPRTDPIIKDAWYPILVQDARLHMGFLISVGLGFLIHWLLKRTPYGFDIRALGANPVATKFTGINIGRIIVITMLLSGGLAGLAGAGEVFGVHHNVSMSIVRGYGYTGIIVAMVAELNPLIVIIVAILFGGLVNGSVILVTSTGTHSSIIYVIQALILLFVLTSRALMNYRIRRDTNGE